MRRAVCEKNAVSTGKHFFLAEHSKEVVGGELQRVSFFYPLALEERERRINPSDVPFSLVLYGSGGQDEVCFKQNVWGMFLSA